MQDSPCDSDMDCTWRKFKISYECWEIFSQFSFFSNFGMFFEHFPLQFRDIIFFFRKFSKNQIFRILNCKQFIYKRDCSTSSPGGNQVDGSPPAPHGLICRLRNLLPGNRTQAISRNLNIIICFGNSYLCRTCVRSILADP